MAKALGNKVKALGNKTKASGCKAKFKAKAVSFKAKPKIFVLRSRPNIPDRHQPGNMSPNSYSGQASAYVHRIALSSYFLLFTY